MKKDTFRQQKTANKLTNAYVTDERLANVNNKGLAAAGVIAIIYCIGMIIYKGMTDQNLLPELILLLLMGVAVYFVELKNHVYDVPKALGRELNTDKTRSARLQRIAYYLADSLIFALAMEVISFLDEKPSFIDMAKDFGAFFIVAFILHFIWSELMVIRYNKYIGSLESEDDE